MAPVKFSAMTVTTSAQWFEAHPGLPGESEVRRHLQERADPKAGRERIGARHEAADKAADQRCGQPDALHHIGIVGAAEAEIDHERRRHRAGEGVAELVENDEGQHDARPCRGSGTRRKRRAPPCVTRLNAPTPASATSRTATSAFGSGLGGHQRRDHADRDQRRHHQIAEVQAACMSAPSNSKPRHDVERAGARGDHADAIGGDERGHAGRLLALVEASRRGRRRSRCPASPMRPPPKARRARPTAAKPPDCRTPGTPRPPSAEAGRRSASRAAGRAGATGSAR